MQCAKKNILDAIGNTPIVKLNHVVGDISHNIFVKCEFMNPGGSIKDRLALHIVNQAEKRGEIQPGATIVEATSGNTGMGLALVAACRGYRCVFVLADKQSQEKIDALKSVGAEVHVCPTDVPADDPRSYYSVAQKLVDDTPGAFYANQYHNLDNPDCHYHMTGREIWEQCGSELDVFVCSIGTGGTVGGISKYLKEKNPKIPIIGVDPIGSIYYDLFYKGQMIKPHTYLLEGIGEDFMPGAMDIRCMDDIVQVGDKESFQMARRLVQEEGLLCGASSGAAVLGALRYLDEHPPQKSGSNILVILPDAANRYASKHLNEAWMNKSFKSH